MNESEQQENKIYELIIVCAEIELPRDGKTAVRFGSQANEEVLIQMCKGDPESWNLVKKVVNDTLNKIETAAKE